MNPLLLLLAQAAPDLPYGPVRMTSAPWYERPEAVAAFCIACAVLAIGLFWLVRMQVRRRPPSLPRARVERLRQGIDRLAQAGAPSPVDAAALLRAALELRHRRPVGHSTARELRESLPCGPATTTALDLLALCEHKRFAGEPSLTADECAQAVAAARALLLEGGVQP